MRPITKIDIITRTEKLDELKLAAGVCRNWRDGHNGEPGVWLRAAKGAPRGVPRAGIRH